ncbi:hypothetical protein K450DRAFT_199139 [Umbelopsis ramanniana AG]|uniref:Uncharacterized protein n=1 Tax=Umbelopsis ramanniana AG TaxID=1314678 RepID=A0AAD5EBE1_UMBRA|nr:uncharacterized protein K450DRAFT_199139 [Umbelopsis ramanniana AG]KAI8579800.1 hypothetical protein K450DRAFT_199139 [Umbelopsis ramanniana AG]
MPIMLNNNDVILFSAFTLKTKRAHIIALKRYLSQHNIPYIVFHPPPPRRPFRWRPKPTAADIPPLDDLMDIDKPFELEVVRYPLAPGDNRYLLGEMERLQGTLMDWCVFSEEMEIFPYSPPRSSRFLPLAEADTPSVPFVRPSAALAAPPAPFDLGDPSSLYGCCISIPTSPFAERGEENLQPSLEQIGEEEFDRFLAGRSREALSSLLMALTRQRCKLL